MTHLRSTVHVPVAAAIAAPAAAGVLALTAIVFPKAALVVAAALLGCGLILYLLARPERTFLAMVFCLPIMGIGVLDVGVTVTLSKFAGALLLLQLLAIRIQGRSSLRIPWARDDAFLVAFWIYCLLAALVFLLSLDRVVPFSGFHLRGPYLRAINQLAVLALMIGIYFATRTVVRDKRMVRRTIQVVLLSFGLLAIYGLYQFVGHRFGLPLTDIRQGPTAISRVGVFLGMTRISSLSGEPKHLALSMLPVIVLLLSLGASGQTAWRTRRASFLLLLLLVTVFMGTFSRGGFILLPLCVAALPLLRGWGGSVRIWKTLILCAAVVVFAGLLGTRLMGVDLAEMFLFRIGETTVQHWEGTIEYPKTFIAWQTAAQHPVFGVGFGNATFYIKKALALQGLTVLSPVENPPNQFLLLLVETGVVGLTLFALFAGRTLARIRKRVRAARDPETRALGTALLSAAFAMLVVYTYMSWFSEPFLWFWLGLARAAADIPQPAD
ncbi:MAG: O-antigen ligase family protein [Candidatus Eisenbacteria sp.]|nr:O-antigen ligase family protein [Candidatus Eisenbacteria bacterium]